MGLDNASEPLRLGKESEEAKALQSLLQARVSSSLIIDGVYGPNTLSVVHEFQHSEHLPLSPSDGTIDICTWNSLKNTEAYVPIYHDVPFIPQPDPGTCWAACTAALRNTTVQEVIASTPPELISNGRIRNYSNVDDWTPLNNFAKTQGLELFPPMSWELTAFRNLIAEGPIMVDMLTYAKRYTAQIGSVGHFVVIVGIRGDGHPAGKGTVLCIQDPFPPCIGERYSVNFFEWINEMPARTYNIFRAQNK